MNNERILERFKESIKATQFNAIRISLASPEQIHALSYGEVKKIETINYRTLKPERDGLFCPRIFGPVQDWTCVCGKYKRMKHRGIICEKCGVEVIESRVRRERMGHVDLVAPVAHIWYLRETPSYMSLVLDMTVKDLERVIYFEAYVVINKGKSSYSVKTVITGGEKQQYIEKNSDDLEFHVEMGAEAIRILLEKMNLSLEISILQAESLKTTSLLLKTRYMKRIKVLSSLNNNKIKPEWMIFTTIPVLSPDLRPLVPIDGGRFASSDLNELYRRVINRNVRLKRLIEINAPSVIIKNEKRMLQESVDALIDNGRRAQPIRLNKRPLKSLSEMLRGKQGRFRQNLLGKRVDYSGRSVIVVDPTLEMDQCGLPKLMALELFKSHVLCELIKRNIAPNIRVARKIVEEMDPIVWDVLEDIVRDYPVILNRAPTLHRLGIQAFYPTLVNSKAITIHPLVTVPYNADFDGDQMGVYIPLSKKAIEEAKNLMMSSINLLSQQNGRPVMIPHQEMVLGLYYLSKERMNVLGSNMKFSSVEEVILAYECNEVNLHAIIDVLIDNSLVKTTVGRVILFNALPDGFEFHYINKVLNKPDLVKLVELIYFKFGNEKTVKTLDKIKNLGFLYATKSGISFSYNHMINPPNRESIIDKAEDAVVSVERLYRNGQITNKERYNKILQIWDNTTMSVAADMLKSLEEIDKEAKENKNGENKEFNFLFVSLDSKSRGSTDQIKQIIGMRGLMSKPSGEIMETPVKSNFKRGLTIFEYFTSTHGARKGQADTALKTANAGYLTRRLVDVSQDVIVTINDCFSTEYLEFEDLTDGGDIVSTLHTRVYGRVLAEDLIDASTNEIILRVGSLVTREDIEKIKESLVFKIKVRSVTKCQARRGVCSKCYGMDLSKDRLVEVGCPVGIIAAQSIGEPGTQLTMRTFHIGGTANLSERSSFIAKQDGYVNLSQIKTVLNRHGQRIIIGRKGLLSIIAKNGRELQKHNLEYGSILNVNNGDFVEKGTQLVEWDGNNTAIVTEFSGTANYIHIITNITVQNRYDDATDKTTVYVIDQKGDKYQPSIAIMDVDQQEIKNYFLPAGAILVCENNENVLPGDILAKIPREVSKTKDITGGLPRIAELFEARMVKDPCVIAESDGKVVIGDIHRGLRKISIINADSTIEYMIPRNKHLNVSDGDFISVGDHITAGTPSLYDLLRIKGIDYVQYYLINQIQLVYRMQGVTINDRHFELIVKQMTRKVRITDPGNTSFLVGDRVDKVQLAFINKALEGEGKNPAKFISELTGITISSLGTESFIAAASFQETTRILAEAAISSQVDHLYGPKENVIIGRLIPAGTGLEQFKKKAMGL